MRSARLRPGLPKVRAVCVAPLRTRGCAPCAALRLSLRPRWKGTSALRLHLSSEAKTEYRYANKKIEDLDNRRKTLSKAIADLSVETLSSQQIELLSGYLDDWENISFEDKRKAADGLISSISATSDYVKIEWKI